MVLPVLVLVVADTVARAQDTGYVAGTSIKVDVRLVNLNVAVTDRAGQPYTALKADNFRVYDNGIEETIHHFSTEDRPYTMGVVLDRSGSMAEMIRDVYRAAFHTVRASKPEDEFFIETFNEKNAMQQDFSQDREVLSRALKDIDAYGGTALYDAMLAGLEHVKRGSHDKKVLLVVTDGADNSSTHRFQETLERARQESVAIYVVGMFDRLMVELEGQREDALEGLLTQLAEATGGRAYFPKTVKQCEQACIAIAQELRQQYAIGYYPSHSMRDGSWHDVQVQLHLPEDQGNKGLRARTRVGYYAPRE
jgi:VWFA-related protein